ncbi:MAG: amidohydrolase [Clostridia bacterium]|nr:amidohydrolase [Clostridia bacterium]
MEISMVKTDIITTAKNGSEWIKNIAGQVYNNPELGFREEKTSALVRAAFSELGIDYEYPLALTGVKATLKGKSDRFNVCIIGELDAIVSRDHPDAAKNSAVHACGHSAQIGAMLGAAYILKNSGVMQYLDGNITFMAVPAEEFNELAYRDALRKEGKIKYFSGKQQLVYEGAFDDVDMAIMLHAMGDEPDAKLYLRGNNLGFISKKLTFRGKSAHASTPSDGTNALNAAALAILGIHSNRDTFTEEERIRIHPIITKGGDVVNTVPDEVEMEMQVRGATTQAIAKANDVVNRAAQGAAQMIGATVETEDIVGYLPLQENEQMICVLEDVAKELIGVENIISDYTLVGSTDMGDISSIMPAIQPSIGGFKGGLHSKDFKICDEDAAIILPAKLMTLAAVELLFDNAAKAQTVKESFVPKFTKEQYLRFLEGEI